MKEEWIFEFTDETREIAFPEHIISTRVELARMCARVCRLLQPQRFLPIGSRIPTDSIVLHCGKMCRLFFFSDKKYVSLAVPLSPREKDGKIQFSIGDCLIDTSSWITIIEKLNDSQDCWEELIDIYGFLESIEGDLDMVALYNKLLNSEYGYIRYDDDLKGFNEAKKNGKEKHHPQHHCDIHLSSHATFKTGLDCKITPKDFINIVDNNTDRWILRR